MNSKDQVGGRYSKYVLGVLLVVYVFNFIDRQIISILAEEIKADLGISDADIGFLYGTAFAVFYAIFGIPLGKLADVWSRKSLISIGLGFWSLMTALVGHGTQLCDARHLSLRRPAWARRAPHPPLSPCSPIISRPGSGPRCSPSIPAASTSAPASACISAA